tara:strand:- start:136 stop:924 length:789 start_codon:yes stop_codon:yes gene_type:complete
MSILLFKAYHWLAHRLRSIHLHGIHSPFVFYLHQTLIKEKAKYYAFDAIESIRAKLLLTDKVIEVKDLGAGSQYSKGNKRSIRSIAQQSLKRPKEAQLMYRLVQEFKPKTILELGTSLGISIAYLAKAAPSAKITSIEGCPQTSKVALLNLKKLNIENVKVINGAFDDHIEEALIDLKVLDFLFIDGNHTEKATLRYFNACLPYLSGKAIVVFDDIYWSKGMLNAWNKIRKNEKVAVSIDLFELGILIFKRDQEKEHFTIYH